MPIISGKNLNADFLGAAKSTLPELPPEGVAVVVTPGPGGGPPAAPGGNLGLAAVAPDGRVLLAIDSRAESVFGGCCACGLGLEAGGTCPEVGACEDWAIDCPAPLPGTDCEPVLAGGVRGGAVGADEGGFCVRGGACG